MATQQLANVPNEDADGQKVNAEESALAEPETGGEEREPQASQNQGEEEKEKHKRKGGWLRKIERAEREAEFWREEALRNRTLAPATPAKEKEADEPKPKQTDFPTYEEYVEALSRWTARQEHKTLSAKEREQETKANWEERQREIVSTYNERLADFREEHDDFNAVVGKMQLTQEIAPGVEIALMEDENGPAIVYYLGQHPEIQDRLNDMSAAGAVKYLGRLSERLFPEGSDAGENEEEEIEEQEPAEQLPRKPSGQRKLPAPITPTRRAAPTDHGLSDSLSAEEWAKRFRKKMKYEE